MAKEDFPSAQPENSENGYSSHHREQISGGWFSFLWETIRIVVVSLAIILPIRYYLIQPFFVNGASMEPNFHDKDYIFVDKLSYRMHPPRRGDVVIFKYPLDPKEYFIKRIIGLPGETIEISAGTVKIFNEENPKGLLLTESGYLSFEQKTSSPMRLKLDSNEYFVMGDNRDHSSDSRQWGTLQRTFISGRALIRLWPFSGITIMQGVDY